MEERSAKFSDHNEARLMLVRGRRVTLSALDGVASQTLITPARQCYSLKSFTSASARLCRAFPIRAIGAAVKSPAQYWQYLELPSGLVQY
jgi:hypothetical protein